MSEGVVQQREVFYSGHVQGVGFRYTVRSLASQYDVTGFVKNLPDGRVQLVVEGDVKEIDALLEAIQEEMGQYVSEMRQTVLAATGRFASFDIRF